MMAAVIIIADASSTSRLLDEVADTVLLDVVVVVEVPDVETVVDVDVDVTVLLDVKLAQGTPINAEEFTVAGLLGSSVITVELVTTLVLFI